MLSTKCMIWTKGQGNPDRIKFFMMRVATNVIGETSSTPGHAERKAYADKVLSGEANVQQMVCAVVTNYTIAAVIDNDETPVDNDIEFTVNSLWDDFSGYEGA